MDAIAHGLARGLASSGVELDVFPADLRGTHAVPGAVGRVQEAAVGAALAASVDALVLFVLDVLEPRAAVASAMAAGVPVVAIHRPAYPVSAAIVVPNYHQGVVLAHALYRALGSPEPGTRRVAIVGGPDIVDDVELVRGAVDGVRGAGLELLNDPFLSQFRNLDDVRGAGSLAVQNVVSSFYPFDGCVVFNDETLLDALEVLAACGLSGAVPLVSRNGSPAVIAEIRRGRTHATFDYHLPEIGFLAARTVLAFDGRRPPAPDALIAAPVGELFTMSNVDSYVPWEERAVPVTLRVHTSKQ
jgi:ABC-type sugar transport system substrate-binding protein